MESDHRYVPHAVFGHPQIAAFGPTRAELDEAGTPYVHYTQNFGDTAYGWALEDTTGILTVYADPDTGLLLSAHCLGPNASTLIQPLIQAASFGQSATEVARGQYWIHPALAEVVENALLGLDLDGSDHRRRAARAWGGARRSAGSRAAPARGRRSLRRRRIRRAAPSALADVLGDEARRSGRRVAVRPRRRR